jgi:hypothetical protein
MGRYRHAFLGNSFSIFSLVSILFHSLLRSTSTSQQGIFLIGRKAGSSLVDLPITVTVVPTEWEPEYEFPAAIWAVLAMTSNTVPGKLISESTTTSPPRESLA